MKENRNLLIAAVILFFLFDWSGKGGIFPGPKPSPVSVSSEKVLVIFEQDDESKYSRGHQRVLSSIESRSELYDFVESLGGEVQNYDDDTKFDFNPDTDWKSMMSVEDRGELPWIVICTPDNGGTSERLPDTAEGFKKLVEEYL